MFKHRLTDISSNENVIGSICWIICPATTPYDGIEMRIGKLAPVYIAACDRGDGTEAPKLICYWLTKDKSTDAKHSEKEITILGMFDHNELVGKRLERKKCDANDFLEKLMKERQTEITKYVANFDYESYDIATPVFN